MKKIFIVFIILFHAFLAFSQTDSIDFVIYKELVFKDSFNDAIVYFDSTQGWDRMKELILSKEIKEYKKNSEFVKMPFSKEERKMILQQIKKYEHHVIDLQQYTKCLEIPSMDSLGKFHKANQELKHAQIKEAVDQKDIKKIDELQKFKWIYGFSKPIFFREKYCVVYYMYILQNAFEGNASVYIMEYDGVTWKKRIRESVGDW